MNKIFKNKNILIYIIYIFIIMNFFNNNLKLEKVDEDFTYANIAYLHENNQTLIEKSSNNKFLLNFLSSNNYYKLNYFFLKNYDFIYNQISKFYDLNYNSLKSYKDIDVSSTNKKLLSKKNKLDHLEYKKSYFKNKFKFANNSKLFEETNFNFFKHYNILYFNNIVFFTLILILSYKYFNFNNYKNIYPLLIYFLTPQINSFILFINSDYYTILLTPIIYLSIINKKYLILFITLFFLHLINRSTLIVSMAICIYYIFILIDYRKIKLKYIILVIAVFLILINILLKYYINNIGQFHPINNSPFDNLINGYIFEFLINIFKSIIILIISALYLDGQNSFIANYYDYFAFVIIIFFSIFLIFKSKIEHKLSPIYFIFAALLFMYFLNGFDQSRHHPLIYFSFLYLLFNNNKIKYQTYLQKLQLIFIFFLVYLNIKIFYIQYIIL